MIIDVLDRRRENRKLAAGDLGIDTSTLYRKIRELNIETPYTDGRSRKR
jgi:transcriptional regulator with PAS, ATPase and Fis domain